MRMVMVVVVDWFGEVDEPVKMSFDVKGFGASVMSA